MYLSRIPAAGLLLSGIASGLSLFRPPRCDFPLAAQPHRAHIHYIHMSASSSAHQDPFPRFSLRRLSHFSPFLRFHPFDGSIPADDPRKHCFLPYPFMVILLHYKRTHSLSEFSHAMHTVLKCNTNSTVHAQYICVAPPETPMGEDIGGFQDAACK